MLPVNWRMWWWQKGCQQRAERTSRGKRNVLSHKLKHISLKFAAFLLWLQSWTSNFSLEFPFPSISPPASHHSSFGFLWPDLPDSPFPYACTSPFAATVAKRPALLLTKTFWTFLLIIPFSLKHCQRVLTNKLSNSDFPCKCSIPCSLHAGR